MIEDEIRDVGRELIQEFFEFQTMEGPTSVSRCMIFNQIIGEPDKNWWRGLTRGRPIMRSESFGNEEEDFLGESIVEDSPQELFHFLKTVAT